MFKEIYFPTQNYNKSKDEIFVHLVKVFGGGSRYLFRTSDPHGSKDFLAKIFGWYCALVNRLGIDIEDALWKKYPGVCPRCLRDVCACGSPLNPIDPEKLLMLAASNVKPRSVQEWQAMFRRLYRSPSGGTDVAPSKERLATVFTRMAEELGEVAEALLMDEVIDENVESVVRNEMADLCAWIFALANNLHFVDPSADGVTLADISWNLYGGKCHRCRKAPCACVPGSFGLELAGQGAMGPAHWDEITGLANSDAKKVYVQKIQGLYEKEQSPYSVIMIDIDDFGRINKNHGAIAGDQILREVSGRMKEQLGNGNVAFRRGGEEFFVVVQGLMNEAQIIAERIRRSFEKEDMIVVTGKEGEVKIAIRASFGVASTNIDGKSPDALEELADERMRKAKAAGKNRVEPPLSKESMDWIDHRKFGI